jgi:hypothetical protein
MLDTFLVVELMNIFLIYALDGGPFPQHSETDFEISRTWRPDNECELVSSVNVLYSFGV